MCINNLDRDVKEALLAGLGHIACAHDLDVVAAILLAHRRKLSFRVINTVLSSHGVAMSEREYKALLSEQRKQPRGTLRARGSPPADGLGKMTTQHPESSAEPRTEPAASSQPESNAARAWKTAFLKQPTEDSNHD